MIEIDTQQIAGQNIYSGPRTLTFNNIPATPLEHKVVIRMEFILSNDGSTRTMRIKVVDTTAGVGVHWEGYVELTTADANEPITVTLSPIVIDASDGLKVIVESMDAVDDNADTQVDAYLFSDDLDYHLNYSATPGAATADSIAENVKAIDALSKAAGDGDLAAILADTNELQADDYPTSIAAIKAETALIVADTNELQTDDIPAALAVIAAYLDSEVAAILEDTGTTLPGLLKAYVQLLARSDAAIETDQVAVLGLINTDEGSGAGNYSSQTDAIEALRDRGDAAWLTGGGATAQQVWEYAGDRILTGLAAASAAKLDDILDGTGGTGLTLNKLTINGNDAAGVIDVDNTGGPGIKVDGTTRGVSITASAGQGVRIIGTGHAVYVDAATGPGIEVVGGTYGVAVSGSTGIAIAGQAGPGVDIAASGDNHGVSIAGSGTGCGIYTVGGVTGDGFYAYGGVTSGDGIRGSANGGGHGIIGTGTGSNNQCGIIGSSDATGILAGGITAVGTGNNVPGLNCYGNGSGSGIYTTSQATGHGIYAYGGATSGDGIRAEAQTGGHGLAGMGVGSNKSGIIGTSSGSGAAGGITAIASANDLPGFYCLGNGSGDGIYAISGGTGDPCNATEEILDALTAGTTDLLQETTIATLATQTGFTLTAGSADDDAYKDQVAVIIDQTTSEQRSVRGISAYTGATKTVTLESAPDFTIATGDTIRIFAIGSGVTAAQVNAQVLDVLNVDTFAEPGSVPAATASIVTMVHWLYTLARNEQTRTETAAAIKNDAGDGDIATAGVSQIDGTFTREEWS